MTTRLPRMGLGVIVALSLAACRAIQPPPPPAPPPPEPEARVPAPEPEEKGTAKGKFEATAYSIEGKTASGSQTREGIVAADPDILPLGTRIRIAGAGSYDGIYVVTDTGRTIKGREVDIYMANDGEAKRFGRKSVNVEVLDRREASR